MEPDGAGIARHQQLLRASDWPHIELQEGMPDDLDPARFLGLHRMAPGRILVESPALLYDFS